MTTPYEKYLREFICKGCHVALLDPHPEEKFREQQYFKCKLCGLAKQIIKEKKYKIVGGK